MSAISYIVFKFCASHGHSQGEQTWKTIQHRPDIQKAPGPHLLTMRTPPQSALYNSLQGPLPLNSFPPSTVTLTGGCAEDWNDP